MRKWALVAKRTLAYGIDIMILFLVLAPLSLLVEQALGIRPATPGQVWVATVISFSLPAWSYFALSDASKSGASLGKKVFRLRVTSRVEQVRLSLGRALARTALKLVPWELAHLFGFALAGLIPELLQTIGIIAANVLALAYFATLLVTGGRRTVHDLAVGTEVTLASAQPSGSREAGQMTNEDP